MWKQRLWFGCAAALALAFCIARTEPILPAAEEAALPVETKYIALTFDDGPQRNTTTRLLDGLRERGASATFFLMGRQIAGNEDLVLRMAAEGHQVGNHTWNHVKLQGAGSAKVAKEVGKTDACLRELLGEDTYWLRPPYGLINPAEKKWIAVPMIQWSVDPKDWEVHNTQRVVCHVMSHVKPGDIILLHDPLSTSVDAALQIVDELQAQGYSFVTVKELMTIYGVQAQGGERYVSGERAEKR